ncbi:MAG TPA: fimbria/pilus outer membrane usher protein [Phenylobacterium sp.]|uniref:fimbria/pilus outer membrane usher protein n=1 Tax=Phenylobacterium sp. TaxID=1871053 RepID=UPI002F94A8D1
MKRPGLKTILGALCILAGAVDAQAQGVASAPPQEPPPGDDELMLVAVAINGVDQQGQFLVARRNWVFLVRAADLAQWRVRSPVAAMVVIEGEDYLPLNALAGAGVQFDSPGQRLLLTMPAELFEARRVLASTTYAPLTEGAFAAFLNYDLSAEYRDKVRGAAFLEAGVSDDWGLVASTVVAGQGAGRQGVTRLDSYFLRDDPQGLTRLVVGDTVTDAANWTRQVRFGGLRWGTEFSLKPGLITFPTPSFSGQAAVPSNVELLVNDALRFHTEVGQGPFSIDQAPVVSGAGEVTLVVRDALGVERRVTSSYYVSSQLLSRGLSAWSLEAGAERRDYGLRSFSYGEPFVSGSFRHGVTDWLTLESRAELSGEVRMAGAGATLVWAPVGEFGFAGAASDGDDGTGWLYRLHFSRITPRWNVALSYQHATSDFSQLGVRDDWARITDQFQAVVGVSLRRWGNLGLAYTDLRYGGGAPTRLLSANYSIGLGERGYLNVFALRSEIEDHRSETTFGAGLTIPLGQHASGYVQADSRNLQGDFRRTPPTEGGWGYRLAASAGDADRQQAGLDWRGDVGEVNLEAARFQGDTGVRMLARGGVLFAGGGTRMTRRVEDAVAVVEVPDLAGVRIYQENRLVTRTDRHGRAVIPDLRAYDRNRLAIAPSDVPIDARMPEDTLLVVPRYRGAARARFAIERDSPATILLQGPDGRIVDAGTAVRTDAGESLFVGHDGEVFVPNVRAGMSLTADLPEGPCRVTVDRAPRGDVLPRIGPLSCALLEAPK